MHLDDLDKVKAAQEALYDLPRDKSSNLPLPRGLLVAIVFIGTVTLWWHFNPVRDFLREFTSSIHDDPIILSEGSQQALGLKHLKGKAVIVYFADAKCGVECQESMSHIASAINSVRTDKADDLVTLFITLNPKKDTSQKLHALTSSYHKDITPLSGSEEVLYGLAEDFRVYYQQEGDLLEHTSTIHILDKNGKPKKELRYPSSSATILKSIYEIL